MPTTSLWPKCNSSKGTHGAIAQVVKYIENEKKTKVNNQNNDQLQMTNIDDPAIKTVGSVIRYVSDKIEGLRFVTGINCTPEGATKKMVYTRKMFGEKGNRVLWHGYQSFAPGESTPEQVHRMSWSWRKNSGVTGLKLLLRHILTGRICITIWSFQMHQSGQKVWR